jgi:succinate dehydrogenase hydrophobic anchor subunit
MVLFRTKKNFKNSNIIFRQQSGGAFSSVVQGKFKKMSLFMELFSVRIDRFYATWEWSYHRLTGLFLLFSIFCSMIGSIALYAYNNETVGLLYLSIDKFMSIIHISDSSVLFSLVLINIFILSVMMLDHLKLGIESILDDYVHNEIGKEVCFLLLRVITLLCIKEIILNSLYLFV